MLAKPEGRSGTRGPSGVLRTDSRLGSIFGAISSRASTEPKTSATGRAIVTVDSIFATGNSFHSLANGGPYSDEFSVLSRTLSPVGDASNREFSPCRQPVLHREHGRRGPRRHSDLRVSVLNVAVSGLGRDAKHTCDLLGL